MAERPILGLRKDERISAVRQTVRIKDLVLSEARRKPTDSDGITSDISNTIGAEIPPDFLLQSGLIDLRWALIFHPNALSAIYLGFGEEYPVTQEFRDARAVIALHSRANVVAQPLLEHGFVVQPQRLEVTTVLPDSTGKPRLVSGFFSPATLKRQSRYVSFEDNEVYAQPQWLHFIQEDLTPLRLPTSRLLNTGDTVYGEVYPLITPRMISLTEHRILADVGSRESHLRSIYKEQTGQEFVTITPGSVKTAWSIDFPTKLDPVRA